ncbi:MAG: hypothetical protein EOP06_20940, partial [Proteobacteria bacterium]
MKMPIRTRLYRLLKALLKSIAVLVLLVVVVLTAAIGYVATHPKETWAYIQENYLPKDLKITWQDLDVQFRRPSGFNFTFDGSITGLHIVKGAPAVDVPVELVRWHMLIAPFTTTKLVINEMTVKAKEPMRFTAGPPTKKTEEENPFEQVRTYIDLLRKSERFKINNFDVSVTEFIFKSYEGTETRIGASLSRAKISEADLIDFAARVILSGAKPASIDANGRLILSNFRKSEPFLDASVVVNGWDVETNQKITVRSDEKSDFVDTIVTANGTVTYRKEKLNIAVRPELNVRLTPDNAQLRLKA